MDRNVNLVYKASPKGAIRKKSINSCVDGLPPHAQAYPCDHYWQINFLQASEHMVLWENCPSPLHV